MNERDIQAIMLDLITKAKVKEKLTEEIACFKGTASEYNATGLHQLGELLFQTGDCNLAIKCYDRAKEIYTEIGMKEMAEYEGKSIEKCLIRSSNTSL